MTTKKKRLAQEVAKAVGAGKAVALETVDFNDPNRPKTCQFLRTFGTATEMKRDQLQKFLRGTVTTPDDFVQRGWCSEEKKVFTRTHPLDFAREWSGKHRRQLSGFLS